MNPAEHQHRAQRRLLQHKLLWLSGKIERGGVLVEGWVGLGLCFLWLCANLKVGGVTLRPLVVKLWGQTITNRRVFLTLGVKHQQCGSHGYTAGTLWQSIESKSGWNMNFGQTFPFAKCGNWLHLCDSFFFFFHISKSLLRQTEQLQTVLKLTGDARDQVDLNSTLTQFHYRGCRAQFKKKKKKKPVVNGSVEV